MMERVAIVGPGGAGKSTFARSLGERTGLPVFHLDRFYWKPGWVETPREEWRLACVNGAVARTARSHGTPIRAEGCPERFDLAFFRWIWNYERDSRSRLDDALRRHGHLDVVELTSRQAMTEFLDDLDLH